jgi:uncharacterized membrane protein required for colicin V production
MDIAHAFNLADVLVLAFIALFAVIGLKKGLVTMVTALASTIGSFLAAVLLARPIASALSGAGGIFGSIRESIRKFFLEKADNVNQSIGTSINDLSLPEFLRKPLAEKLDLSAPLSQGAEALAQSVFRLLLTGIAAIVVFIAVLLLFRLVSSVLNAFFSKISFLNAANRTLGLVAGVVNGVVLLLVIMAVIGLFSPLMPKLSEGIQGSLAARYFYDFNLFLSLLAKLVSKAA